MRGATTTTGASPTNGTRRARHVLTLALGLAFSCSTGEDRPVPGAVGADGGATTTPTIDASGTAPDARSRARAGPRASRGRGACTRVDRPRSSRRGAARVRAPAADGARAGSAPSGRGSVGACAPAARAHARVGGPVHGPRRRGARRPRRTWPRGGTGRARRRARERTRVRRGARWRPGYPGGTGPAKLALDWRRAWNEVARAAPPCVRGEAMVAPHPGRPPRVGRRDRRGVRALARDPLRPAADDRPGTERDGDPRAGAGAMKAERKEPVR